jgi:2'-hydroxyisoflavone reductase
MMNILIIGGTRFVGLAIVHAALQRGHTLTVFHRGKNALPNNLQVERVFGDREDLASLEPLRGRTWDAVIDTSGYVPRSVDAAAQALSQCGGYTFISTVSVYKDHATPHTDENYPLGSIDDAAADAVISAAQITGENYGPLKARSEAAVVRAFGARALIVRPGIIVGPNDHTERFIYWVRRLQRGGDVLLPAVLDHPWQLIDARDLADFVVTQTEQRAHGVFNACGPATPARGIFDAIAAGVSADAPSAALVPFSAAFSEQHSLFDWQLLPLLVPAGGSHDGLYQVNCDRARAAGLRHRPMAETVSDIAAWDAARGAPALKGGLPAEREAELLALWRAG